MKKLSLIFLVSILVNMSFAQVGIGTTNPEAMLDVNGKVMIKEFANVQNGNSKTLKFLQDSANPNLAEDIKAETVDYDALGTVLRSYNTFDLNITQAQNTEILAPSFIADDNPWITHGFSDQDFVLESDAKTVELLFFYNLKNCRDLNLCGPLTTYNGIDVNTGNPITPLQSVRNYFCYLRQPYQLRLSLIRIDITPNDIILSQVIRTESGKRNPNATLTSSPEGFEQFSQILNNVTAGTYRLKVEGRKVPRVQAGNPNGFIPEGVAFFDNVSYNPTDTEWQNIFVVSLSDAKADFIIFENYID